LVQVMTTDSWAKATAPSPPCVAIFTMGTDPL
jgi:hypothetical protein